MFKALTSFTHASFADSLVLEPLGLDVVIVDFFQEKMLAPNLPALTAHLHSALPTFRAVAFPRLAYLHRAFSWQVIIIKFQLLGGLSVRDCNKVGSNVLDSWIMS